MPRQPPPGFWSFPEGGAVLTTYGQIVARAPVFILKRPILVSFLPVPFICDAPFSLSRIYCFSVRDGNCTVPG